MRRNNQCWRICQVETSYFHYECVPGRLVVELVRQLFTLLLVFAELLAHLSNTWGVRVWLYTKCSIQKCASEDQSVQMLRTPDTWMTHTAHKKRHNLLGVKTFNPLKPQLNSICYLLALLAHHFLHVSRIRVKSLTFRRLMSYIYIYIWSTHSWCF